ncbi:putative 2-isopropylmalate synthase [Triangularia setosa]|uniref:2-isopropylmalate synthase n=1 Tax=Triangularia setosa TaxID=2587417 RepID=A0AAN7A0X2_9PEZI|nr:putative 2-isopropylmalate synthase [Podospora setosa]
MDGDAKLRFFQHLVRFGYKEIEVSYPSASQTEFDFTRRLITTGAIPDDVWIQVMAPCREELIRTTIEAARGAKQVIVHIHLSTSEVFREVVFNMTEQETIDLADSPDPQMRQTAWTLEFTPENFQDTSLEFALEICEAVKAAWEPMEENKIIFNMAATVEAAMPNVFADQIEYFCDHISEREKVSVSLHNHNDRGCAVAATEMGQLAGADRVEGCLFSNGERTGNVDLVTLALNLFTQGVDPGIDFGNINEVVEMVEELTKIPVHFRAPYAGKYTFCTFTGTHQDAIRKGYKARARLEQKMGPSAKWRMPYLPMDPADLGRKHEAIIRLNSQSGKGGIGWLVNEVFEIDMPKDLEIAFTRVVKGYSEEKGIEITREIIEDLFRSHYMLSKPEGVQLVSCTLRTGKVCSAKPNGVNGHAANGVTSVNGIKDHVNGDNEPNGKILEHDHTKTVHLKAVIAIQGVRQEISGSGEDILTCLVDAVRELGFFFDVADYRTEWQHHEGAEDTRRSAGFVKLTSRDKIAWGVGIHADSILASLHAILSATAKLE